MKERDLDLSDGFSCMCQGKKEFVSINVDGTRKHFQKRLLFLIPKKELHLEFVKRFGRKIGLSKFC